MQNRIREYRKRQGLTQLELAVRAKVGRSSISEIERGLRLPYIDTAFLIAYALDSSVEDIFYFEKGQNDE